MIILMLDKHHCGTYQTTLCKQPGKSGNEHCDGGNRGALFDIVIFMSEVITWQSLSNYTIIMMVH